MRHSLEKIQKKSLREQVIDAIRDAVIEGKFKPGEKIPEQDLAEQLGVSRTPIREAIRILEQQGLLYIVPKSGTFVTEVDPEDLKDSLSIRIALEELALRQGIERSSPVQWDSLCENLRCVLDGMKRAVEQGDTITATELDIEWHTILIDAAQNRHLSRLWRDMGLQYLVWSPERSLYPLAQEKWSDISYIRHQELFNVLKRRNPDECCHAIRLHILQKLSDLETGL
jgi:DNA-binding GntR family transcriptional regulator